MKLVSITVLVLFVFLAPQTSARAEILGPACVIKGDTLMIDGKRSFGSCRGGTTVRLFGVVAPDLNQTCPAPGGRQWQCGRASAAMLLEKVKGRNLVCKGTTRNADGEFLGICILNGEDLNRRMVLEGWVLAYPRHSVKYMADEKEAASRRKGLWQGTPGAPFKWRNR